MSISPSQRFRGYSWWCVTTAYSGLWQGDVAVIQPGSEKNGYPSIASWVYGKWLTVKKGWVIINELWIRLRENLNRIHPGITSTLGGEISELLEKAGNKYLPVRRCARLRTEAKMHAVSYCHQFRKGRK